ncbi:MAG: tetratricopeptide repeat protein [Verrucomicrobiia bacterium]|jgi:tetratricopeptide (TPR) repeat protein
MQRAILGAVCALVIGVYAGTVHSGFWESLSLNPAESYYNLMVEGFRAGQLSLKLDVPPGLSQLADPYDPVANAHYRGAFYRLHDLTYYKGKLYLYFGVTPALLLFWPCVALTGQYLFHRQAVAIFCTTGYLTSLGVLCALWRRYFAEVSVWVMAAGALALGLATGIPVLLSRCSVYEVPISCGYMLTMAALGAIWCALHNPDRKGRWLVAASVAYGLAIGARPSLLYGAVILLVPVAQAWRERRPIWPLVIAAVAPITLAGLGLMLYNTQRFGNPIDFGWHYQLAASHEVTQQLFSVRHVWFNVQSYFLQPVLWSRHFPFVNDAIAPLVPAGHGLPEAPFGILPNVPLVWLALGVPMAWRGRSGPVRSTLRWFVLAVALLSGICASIMGLFFAACVRFETEFLPTMVLLAMAGVFGLERTFARQPVWRPVVRCGWCLLLGFSVVFNVLSSIEHHAESEHDLGMTMMELGKTAEAIDRFREAVRLDPDYAAAHNELGLALEQTGRIDEAIQQYEQASRLRPDLAEAHYNWGNALVRTHNLDAAIRQYREVLCLQPNDREAHYNTGEILHALGRVREAIEQYEQALQIDPTYAAAHDKLGNALAQSGRLDDAIAHFEQALRLEPGYAAAHNGLANARMLQGKVEEAIRHYEQALQINPDSGATHYNLGVALERVGRVREAKEHYEQALKLKPDLAAAKDALARLQAGQ